jgi:hypothetical protein
MFKVIDVGLGRTGTMSLKHALEGLGFGKCYHFSDIYTHLEHLDLWRAVSRGEEVDWEKSFAGYQASVYWSPCYDYLHFLNRYPETKIILTVRDPEKWYKSTYDTIYSYNRLTLKRILFLHLLIPFKPELKQLYAVWRFQDQMLWGKTFKGRFHDKKFAIDIFNKHIEEVKKNVPSERLLIYNIKEGWKPLCDFLQVPRPDAEFPHVNDSSSFITWRDGLFKDILFGNCASK